MNLTSTPPQEEYRFGNCVLRSDTRELLRDGQVQQIERRTFDLIHYLLRQEGRVVGKDELLANVWSNRHVTDSVIAQSIMKARKALGITAREEGPIRTVHRVGYRFVGELRREARPSHMSFTEPPRTVPGVHWLPTEADESLADQTWMKTGLISLVAHLLRSNGVVVHQGVSGTGMAGINPARAACMPMALVHTRVRLVEDRYELFWHLQWDTDDHHGSVEGGSPVELFLRAAIEVALLVRLRALSVMGVEASAEPWRDLMRLLQLCDNLDTREHAAPLESLMGQLQSGTPTRFAECLLILAQRGEASTPTHAHHLTLRALGRDEHGHAGWAELCMGIHALYLPDPDRARSHVIRAIELMLPAKQGGRVAKGLSLASHVLATLGDLDQAEHTLARAAQINGQSLSSSTAAWQDLQAAELCVLRGDIASQGSLFAKAVISSQKLGLDAHTAFALVYSALHHVARGDLATALQQLQSAQCLSDRGGWPRARVLANLHLGLLCARMEDREELDRCVSRLEERRLGGTWLGAAAVNWLHARVHVLDHDIEAALPLLRKARTALSRLGAWWQEDAWLFEGQALLLDGQRSSAHELLQHLQMRSRHQDRPLPRASALAMEGLLARFDGRNLLATNLVERARSLATGSVLEPTLAMLLTGWRSGRSEMFQLPGGSGDLLPRKLAAAHMDRHIVRTARERPGAAWSAWSA